MESNSVVLMIPWSQTPRHWCFVKSNSMVLMTLWSKCPLYWYREVNLHGTDNTAESNSMVLITLWSQIPRYCWYPGVKLQCTVVVQYCTVVDTLEWSRLVKTRRCHAALRVRLREIHSWTLKHSICSWNERADRNYQEWNTQGLLSSF